MNFDDCIIYSFSNQNGTFDFIRVTSELHDLLEIHGLEEEFAEVYRELNLPGTITLLIKLGLSKTSVIKNMQFFPQCSKEMAFKMMKDLNIELEPENEENILYN